MSIQKQFVLRYREEGHIRFQIPEICCHQPAADSLVSQLKEVDGVYRVSIFKSAQKLSIRFNEAVCDFSQLARQLSQILAKMEKEQAFVSAKKNHSEHYSEPFKEKVKNTKIASWFREKYTDTKETIQAAKVITRLGMKKPKALVNDPEKAIIDFLNDVLVLYLIKLHWSRITHEWIPKPFVHRYEWLATFYMFYLLMRSRRPKK